MGLDLRIISEDGKLKIADVLRDHGFDVSVDERTVVVTDEMCAELGIEPPTLPVVVTTVRCRRGDDEITLSITRNDEHSEGFNIYIPNLWSWRPSRKRRLSKLQSDVTEILESQGAYWPFDE